MTDLGSMRAWLTTANDANLDFYLNFFYPLYLLGIAGGILFVVLYRKKVMSQTQHVSEMLMGRAKVQSGRRARTRPSRLDNCHPILVQNERRIY
jgi:hypothetical protein